MLNVSLFFVNNRFTALLITSIFDFKPYFPCMWDFCLYEYIQVYKYLVWKWIRSILRLGRGGGCKLSETDDIATGMIMVYGSQCPQAGFEDIKAYRREEKGNHIP